MKLTEYLKPYWLIALISPLFMIIEVSVDILQPYLMSSIIDKGVLGGSYGVIISTGIKMLILAVIGGIAGISATGFASSVSQNFGNDLRCDAFKKVMTFSLDQADKFTTGSIITRLTNDITLLQDLVEMALRMFIRAPLLFIGGIIVALNLSIKFGLVLMIGLPVQVLIVFLLLSKASPLFEIVQKKLDRMNSVVQENIANIRVIKAYNREDYEIKRFEGSNIDFVKTSMRVAKLMALLDPLLMIVMNLSVIVIIYLGGLQVQAKVMQVGQVMAAVTYITQIFMSVMMVGMMFQSISRGKASSKRIRELLESDPDIVSRSCKNKNKNGNIVFENVDFNYLGLSGQPVLKNINLKIEPAETVAILGATGSGKTSLVNLIPRFYDVTAGCLSVDGINVKDYDTEILRSKIGLVLQKSELFSGSIMENIRWGRENASDDEVIKAAKIAQADGFITNFQDGYNTIISEKGSSLSGGQKQRLCIARAILKKPEILIFDDSTSALDLGTEARLYKALQENFKDVTVIIIAQRISSIMNADRIVVLDNGKIVDIGTHHELLQKSAIYMNIYDSQVRQGAAVNA